ncbi:hypothetical protein TrRE_jg7483 [Triparma retinervis]|uniref:Uncharacterized protein n=1 Tax=Triparma retinervis TaxID=2557542 RepID=A0A9W7DT52_9STRA|nr:hypothetical protein TrRE_jg7483 [Triparma retinervis]
MENDTSTTSAATAILASTSTSSLYSSQALFALCSWPFSLKLLWAPIVDAVFIKRIGRRKSWLLPTQFLAGLLMVAGAKIVNEQITLPPNLETLSPPALISSLQSLPFDIRFVTLFFFSLYLLLATQDIAVDGWALTMLHPKNRGKGPVCNSIGQNIGTLLSYTGFLALNDETVSAGIRRAFGMKELGGDGTKRLTLVAICDLAMLQVVKHYSSSPLLLYSTLIVSTALQTVASSLQFNAQMTFFASRVDRNIGGSYMTLLNTFANLGGTWPASPALWIMGKISGGGGDGYAPMQLLLSGAGIAYLVAVNGRIKWLGESKEEDWTTESMEGGDGTKKSKAKSKKGV